jgi:hypothetical protein
MAAAGKSFFPTENICNFSAEKDIFLTEMRKLCTNPWETAPR